jgi:ABC-type multidrug transport system ATPase subunit
MTNSLPRDTPDIDVLVDSTLQSLGLLDVANNKIGTPIQRGISGGQKRRVTIACSVVARPRVLVLDEPTSGLDSGSAYEVMASSSMSLCCQPLQLLSNFCS